MPLGNPIRKQNESRIVSVLATEGQTVFTVQVDTSSITSVYFVMVLDSVIQKTLQQVMDQQLH